MQQANCTSGWTTNATRTNCITADFNFNLVDNTTVGTCAVNFEFDDLNDFMFCLNSDFTFETYTAPVPSLDAQLIIDNQNYNANILWFTVIAAIYCFAFFKGFQTGLTR